MFMQNFCYVLQFEVPVARVTDDLTTLSEISESIIVTELNNRYNQNVIYVSNLSFSKRTIS